MTLSRVAMLLMSSPMERKVSYAQLEEFHAVGDAVFPLIDSGLDAPEGLAFDGRSSTLYVTDRGAQKIFLYTLGVTSCDNVSQNCAGVQYKVVVRSVQLAVVESVTAPGVAVDAMGNLYFTDETLRTVNRLDRCSIKRIIDGYSSASDLKRMPVREAAAITMNNGGAPFAIIVLYKAGDSPNVGVPAGISTDGTEVFWANREDGLRCGSVASGPARPDALPGPPGGGGVRLASFGVKAASQPEAVPPPASRALATPTDGAEGVVALEGMAIFGGRTQRLYGICQAAAVTQELTSALSMPRGMVWDGDSTVYVADAGVDAVYSVPTGRCRENLPLRHVVNFHQVYGLALIRSTDPAFAAALASQAATDAGALTSGSGGGDGTGGVVSWLFGAD